jgi:hypothetical protein
MHNKLSTLLRTNPFSSFLFVEVIKDQVFFLLLYISLDHIQIFQIHAPK